VDDRLITLCVLRVKIRLLLALALGVRGGWKICDFAPDRRGAAGSRGWKLNAPGIALGELVMAGLACDLRLSADRVKAMKGSFG